MLALSFGAIGNVMQENRQFESRRKSPKPLAAVTVLGFLAACSPTLETHGHLPDPEIVNSVRIGKSNREQVTAMLGTPSAISTFDKEAWYYVGTRTSKFAFLEPEILERTVLVIRFDKDGIVRQVERLSKDDGRDVQIVERKTPTRGRELTILEQLVGNVGRFGGGGGSGEGGPLGDP
jgi:outer membrane protein assembly factor BamE (lipoprotein component of BamABCDE complex)